MPKLEKYDDDLLLIQEVESRPSLYDKKHADFADNQIREREWTEAAKKLKMSAAQMKTRWRSLRDRFVRVARNAAELGEDIEEFSNWKLIPHLKFILNHLGKVHQFCNSKTDNFEQISMDCIGDSNNIDLTDKQFKMRTPKKEKIKEADPIVEETQIEVINFAELDVLETRNKRNIEESMKESRLTYQGHCNINNTKPNEEELNYADLYSSEKPYKRKYSEITYSGNHEHFLHILADKLEQLSDEEREDIKMEMLIEIHQRIKARRQRRKSAKHL